MNFVTVHMAHDVRALAYLVLIPDDVKEEEKVDRDADCAGEAGYADDDDDDDDDDDGGEH